MNITTPTPNVNLSFLSPPGGGHLPDLAGGVGGGAGKEETQNSVADVIAVIEFHAPYAMLINKYVTPVWYVVGLIGNVISALYWSSQRIRTCNTAAVYLTSLALADFSYLALHVFYELENPWLVHTLNVDGWCQLWNGLYMAAQYFCVFLVCAFTIERFLSICHPFKSERFGRTRSPRIILFLLLASLALGSPQGYFWLVADTCECHVRQTQLTQASFYTIWNWCTDIIIFGALPVLVLCLNVCVLRKVRSAGRLRLSDSHYSHSGYSRVGASKGGSRHGGSGSGSGSGVGSAGPAGKNYGVGAVSDGCGSTGGGGGAGGGLKSSKKSTTTSTSSTSAPNNATTTTNITTNSTTTSTSAAAAAAATAAAAAAHNSSSLNGTFSSTSGGSHNFTATTVTLLWVSFYLIFTTLPVTIVYAIQTAIPTGKSMSLVEMGRDPVWQTYISYYATRVIIREIGMSHHVGNVFIYLATNRRFRRQLDKRFTSRKRSPCNDTESTNLHEMHQLKAHKGTCM